MAEYDPNVAGRRTAKIDGLRTGLFAVLLVALAVAAVSACPFGMSSSMTQQTDPSSHGCDSSENDIALCPSVGDMHPLAMKVRGPLAPAAPATVERLTGPAVQVPADGPRIALASETRSPPPAPLRI
ncbi:MAG: hypothetical protein OEV43_09380 [Coriobacteriia bacterium]|nr:hypothetical protein [Coriobacteriia bacterium]